MSSLDDWLDFFLDAGLPKDAANTYAHSFHENRIKLSMLQDLNKEYLRDLGIYRTGDIILVLKKAKAFLEGGPKKKVPVSRSRSRSPVMVATKRKSVVDKSEAKLTKFTKREPSFEDVSPRPPPNLKIRSDHTPPRKSSAAMDQVPEKAAKNGKAMQSIFARLGSKSHIEAEERLVSQTKVLSLTKKTGPSPKQRVLLVKKVPAKASFTDSSGDEDEPSFSKEKSVSFSEQDEIMEYAAAKKKQQQSPKVAKAAQRQRIVTVHDRLGSKKAGEPRILAKSLKTGTLEKSKPVLKAVTMRSDEILKEQRSSVHDRISINATALSKRRVETRLAAKPFGGGMAFKRKTDKPDKVSNGRSLSVFDRLGLNKI